MPGAMSWTHRCGNPVLSCISRVFFRSPVTDPYCGLRAFRREAVLALDLRSLGMEFAYEMVIKATLHGLRIAQVPITLYKDGRGYPSHLRTWRDGWRTLRFMLLYSPRWLFLIPGIILLLCGAGGGAVLLAGPVTIGRAGFDANTLLVMAMAVLVGFQLIVFACVTTIFAWTEGLLPRNPRVDRLFRYVTLEVGLVIGALFALLGFGLLVWGVAFWRAHGFGALSYPQSLRIVIPGVTALTLGVQMISSSFVMSMLGLARK